MKRKLIAFAGRKRSGKTTLAKELQEKDNAVIITIANYLKKLCCEIMNMTFDDFILKKDNGYIFDAIPNERWYSIISKETDINVDDIRKELDGKHITTIRQLLQVIGTDVIRKYNEDWHVKKMVEEIERYPNDTLIAIDDVRFPNEREAILKRSGRVFFIVRPNVSEVSNHPSETALKWQDFDVNDVIINSYLPLENFKYRFFVHYLSDFKCYEPNSIFLNENMDLLDCGNFGYNMDENDDFLKDIIRQIKDDKLFKDYGIIRYRTFFDNYVKRYVKEVDNKTKFCNDSYQKTFLTINPLITENIKALLS